jgi:hypothetical protein
MFIHSSQFCIFLALRVEWAKAKARADRWEEEVVLLDEEMQWVLAFCEWKNAWWKEQVTQRPAVSPEVDEGLSAYAQEQAAMETALNVSFTRKWSAVRTRAHPLINKLMGIEPVDADVTMEDAGDVEFLIGEEDDEGGGSDYEE